MVKTNEEHSNSTRTQSRRSSRKASTSQRTRKRRLSIDKSEKGAGSSVKKNVCTPPDANAINDEDNEESQLDDEENEERNDGGLVLTKSMLCRQDIEEDSLLTNEAKASTSQDYMPEEADDDVSSQSAVSDDSADTIASPQLKTPKSGRKSGLNESGEKNKLNTFNEGLFYGWTDEWHPEFMYRMPGDIVLAAIKESGTEGKGRAEIGVRLAMNTATKAGNRRVSNYINQVQKNHAQYVGQFQKMEGKIRMIKYFWKKSTKPDAFKILFDNFRLQTGKACPFKMGQTIKFPDTKLSTLRISDVSLRRINDILQMLHSEKIIVTLSRILKRLSSIESEMGYNFEIDKKSMLKCLYALRREGFLNIFDTYITDQNASHVVQVVTIPEITSHEDPEVQKTIQHTVAKYHEEGRVFPHGQLKYGIKRQAEFKAASTSQAVENTESFEDLEVVCKLENITMNDRCTLYRIASMKGFTVIDPDPSQTQVDQTQITEKFQEPIFNLEDNDDGQTNKSSDATENLSHANDVLTVGGRPKKGVGEQRLELGYQAKFIRLCILHDIAWHFVYGVSDGPSVFEKFPPHVHPLSYPELPISELHVYEDSESPYRFMPWCKFDDHPRGWFMLHDLFCALPLSIFIATIPIPSGIPQNVLLQYLEHPIARHVPLANLPLCLRRPIFNDKKTIKHFEHLFLSLGGIRLVLLASSSDPKRSFVPNVSTFFIAQKAELFDTSTSEKGYAAISGCIDTYPRFVYSFDSHTDVLLFWYHLRAIGESTPLNYRIEQNNAEVTARYRRLSLGMFDKRQIAWFGDSRKPPTGILPAVLPQDGCAGLDFAFFAHLKRHWELNYHPTSIVLWLVSWFRNASDSSRPIIEQRVKNLQHDWDSVVRTLLQFDNDSSRFKKPVAGTCTQNMSPIETKLKKRVTQKRKMKLDAVDYLSHRNRMSMRCRFSKRERDMLIIIRGVGFFLNPVYRFWLDPVVVREIMHKYVPESRTKTVQSLLAAATREMSRPARIAFLQKIVRCLQQSTEMRQLRNEITQKPLTEIEEKFEFFNKAFEAANSVLFADKDKILPSSNMPEKVFFDFLAQNNLYVILSRSQPKDITPLRSQNPHTLSDVQHCVISNALLSVFLSNALKLRIEFAEAVLERFNASDVNIALESLRTDGLLSKSRATDTTPALRHLWGLNSYFRSFFSNRFHPELIDQYFKMVSLLQDSDGEAYFGDMEDYCAAIVMASESFYNGSAFLEFVVDSVVLETFEKAANTNKQIRFLESADLHLEKITLELFPSATPDDTPNVSDIYDAILDKAMPTFPKPLELEQWLSSLTFDEQIVKNIRLIAIAIREHMFEGIDYQELQNCVDIEPADLFFAIDQLKKAHQIMEVGVDTHRLVFHASCEAWVILQCGKRYVPRPWLRLDGELCTVTLRWMCEAVLLVVVANPGILFKDIKARFIVALQPVCVEELLMVLQYCRCIKEHIEECDDERLSGPFESATKTKIIRYFEPTVDCLKRFAMIFGKINVARLSQP